MVQKHKKTAYRLESDLTGQSPWTSKVILYFVIRLGSPNNSRQMSTWYSYEQVEPTGGRDVVVW